MQQELDFEFSIRDALKRSWTMFTRHTWFFVALTLVMVVISFVSKGNGHTLLSLLAAIVSILWTYVWLSVALAAVDGKEGMLTFDSLKLHLPTFRQFGLLFCIALLTALIIGIGFIALIIPGIYLMTRLWFANLSFVDRQGKVKDALKHSWRLVKGDLFWTVFLTLIIFIALALVGLVFFGFGLLVTYPIAMLLMAQLYRALSTHAAARESVAIQPKEIPPAPVEPTPEPAPTV